jgi:hypothetical protein
LADATLAVQTKLTIARYGVWHLLLLYPCADELGFSRAVPVALVKGNISDEGAGPDIAMPVSIGVSIFLIWVVLAVLLLSAQLVTYYQYSILINSIV